MEQIELGKTGLKVGRLGLGAGPFGGIYGGKDEKELGQVLEKSIAAGVNYIDSAPWYGQGESEKMLGKFLPTIDRSKFVIATKVARYEKNPKKMFDFSHDRALRSVDESLARLGLDFVDIIQVHDVEFAPNIEIIINETLPALEKVKKAGKAKFIGVTGYPLHTLNEIIEKSTVKIDLVLAYTRGSLADQSLNKYLPAWRERGIAVINASPLAMGLFRNNGPQPWHPANQDLKDKVNECVAECQSKGIDISRLALRYSFDEVSADVVLCGTARVNELEENIKNAQTPLTNEEKEAQAKILEKLKDVQGHWEGKEIKAYWNRINGVEDDLPYFRD